MNDEWSFLSPVVPHSWDTDNRRILIDRWSLIIDGLTIDMILDLFVENFDTLARRMVLLFAFPEPGLHPSFSTASCAIVHLF